MFQRIKGAIDSRIAEEQARQRSSQASPSRPTPGTRRPATRDESPSKRPERTGARGRKDGDPPRKAPDPAEFEPEFVVGEDDMPSRSGTPRPAEPKRQTSSSESAPDSNPDAVNGVAQEKPATKDSVVVEVPTDVRVKLRKLDKLESKYHELLRSYRVAHARVQTIEPFETSLKENTPLTSISDPGALVEYLNNVNLKGDMVLDELKRVSSERDSYKQKLAEAEQKTKEAWDEIAGLRKPEPRTIPIDNTRKKSPTDGREPRESVDGDPLGVVVQPGSPSIKSRKGSLASLSIFSPKSKPAGSPTVEEKPDDLFSFDHEIPRMEAEIQEKQGRIDQLQDEVKSLKGDLAVTRESTQSMAECLETATRDLNVLREGKHNTESELEVQQSASQKEIDRVKAALKGAEEELRDLKSSIDSRDDNLVGDLTNRLDEAKQEINGLHTKLASGDGQMQIETLESKVKELEAEVSTLHADAKTNEKRVETLSGLVNNLRGQLQTSDEALRETRNDLKQQVAQQQAKSEASAEEGRAEKGKENLNGAPTDQANSGPKMAEPTVDSNAMGKKKNKKKKKSGKSTTDTSTEAPPTGKPEPASKRADTTQASVSSNYTLSKLQTELDQLRLSVTEKDTALENIRRNLKDQDDLKEEIESLRDDLINLGQEHVEAKDRAKDLLAEKKILQATIDELEKEVGDLKASNAISTTGSEEKHNALIQQMEEMKSKSITFQTDLSAAEKLANTRFKDITELRSIIQKAQPELTTLRAESAELKVIRETLGKKEEQLKELNDGQVILQSDLTVLKRTLGEREAEAKTLDQKIAQETNSRLRAEESCTKSSQEIHDLIVEKQHATESIDRLSRELAFAREELRTSRLKLQELDQQVSKLLNNNEELKEETELKTAQCASAQSLMASMRDQTTEMATQMKETRERCESLDEEVAEAHRLLSERTREGETMRRLLADVEGRADARTRELKERMDTAIEERDRAEEEASTAGRRKARKMEEMRNKVREAERNLKRAEDDKEELENAQRDWRRRREDLELRTEQSTREAEEVRKAMSDLRDALDESEKQARDLERQKAELRRSVDETQQRLEKLQRSNKSMADEIRTIQVAKTKAADSGAQSSRSSMDSAPSMSRLNSPGPKNRLAPAASTDAANGPAPGAMDYVYLKNVLLQFLEQKDKKHQMQLIPVLGMLLHFDRKDEQKWMSAISTK
ncbi:MAG: hypothetical protein Q9195_006304 [Heterodermia aff. obscurata]